MMLSPLVLKAPSRAVAVIKVAAVSPSSSR
jgi:hypothetical protein